MKTILAMASALLCAISVLAVPARAETCWAATGNWQDASPVSCKIADSREPPASSARAHAVKTIPDDGGEEPASIY